VIKNFYFYVVAGLVSIVFFFPLFQAPLLGETAPPVSASLSAARNCNNRLALSSVKQRRRSSWLKCAALYKESYHRHRNPEVKKEASSGLASLYAQMGQRFKKPQDIRKQSYWVKVNARLTGAGSPASPDQNAIHLPEEETIYNLRSWNHENFVRIVVDVKAPARFEPRPGPEPGTLKVLFPGASLAANLSGKTLSINDGRSMTAKFEKDDQGVTLTLTDIPNTDYKVTRLKDPERVVLDFRKESLPLLKPAPAVGASAPPVLQPKKTLEDLSPLKTGIHNIVIDPGHGGKDPGAVGLTGYTEKEAVLDIGLRLRDLLKRDMNIHVIMTRSRDVFIPLEERTRIANQANADLFISIHANSSPHRTARGIEIYLLGRARDKDALRTAARENNSSEREASNLQKTLLSIQKDLSREFKSEESQELAHLTRYSFMENLRPGYPVVDLGVKTAPFFVLMNTSMPSILAEVSFISNPAEEQRLKSQEYRQKMAQSLLEAIKKYMTANSNAYAS